MEISNERTIHYELFLGGFHVAFLYLDSLNLRPISGLLFFTLLSTVVFTRFFPLTTVGNSGGDADNSDIEDLAGMVSTAGSEVLLSVASFSNALLNNFSSVDHLYKQGAVLQWP